MYHILFILRKFQYDFFVNDAKFVECEYHVFQRIQLKKSSFNFD